MSNQPAGGRPQTYTGALEDQVVEYRALAYELTRHDVGEWEHLNHVAKLVSSTREALLIGDIDEAMHLLARAEGTLLTMRVEDIAENKAHRAIARGQGVTARKNNPMPRKLIASLGGRAVVEKRGRAHMAQIATRGGEAVVDKYGTSQMLALSIWARGYDVVLPSEREKPAVAAAGQNALPKE